MNHCTTHFSPADAGDASVRSPLSRIAVAAALVMAGISTNSYALGFGKLHVQSALGQPLHAEVEILDARPGELRAGLAPAANYSKRGLDYNPIVSSIRSSVQRINGRTVLRLTSDRPMSDPFLDVVLQANDGAGQVVRDYSILLDPPSRAHRAAPAVTAAEVSAPRHRAAPPRAADVAPRPATARHAAARPAAPAGKASRHASHGAKVVRVRPGDTAGSLAAMRKPANVSLDQMLVAMLRANPHAFIDGNVNRLKSGAVIQMPSASQATSTAAPQASREIAAQSADFRSYRHKLAETTTTQATTNARQSGGAVQAQVQDTQSAHAAAPDALTLSKGALKGKNKTEERIAKAAQEKANNSRTNELNKNLDDLKKLSAAAGAASSTGGQAASAPKAGALVATTPAALQAASGAASAASSAASTASAAKAPLKTASAPLKKKHITPAPAPVKEEPGFFSSLLDNPLLLAGGAGVLALVGGLIAFRARQRKKEAETQESSFLESNFAPDSFFHASGGKDVDTSDSGVQTDINQSSMLYSPSQLDAEADVDPISEADVYMAYGRDLQAEEILKDALVKYPGRVAILAKLLEIYHRRRDAKAYAQTAQTLKNLTQAAGPDWDLARKNGLALEPGNPLYTDASVPAASSTPASESGAVLSSTELPESVPASLLPGQAAAVSSAPPKAPVKPYVDTLPPDTQPAPTDVPAQTTGLTLDFNELDASHAAASLTPATVVLPTEAPAIAPTPVDMPVAVPVATQQPTAPAASIPPTASDAADSEQPLDFDWKGLSLDLDHAPEIQKNGVAPEPAAAPEAEAMHALTTKLALAREFLAIGDKDGARAMAQEVADHATGELQAEARKFVQEIA